VVVLASTEDSECLHRQRRHEDLTSKVFHARKIVGVIAQLSAQRWRASDMARPAVGLSAPLAASSRRRLYQCRRDAVVDSFDVVVVGAGPTGLACGIELKKRGVRAVLIDKGCVVNSITTTQTTWCSSPRPSC